MFTGIIEALGSVRSITKKQNNHIWQVSASFSAELRIGQSIAHNGVCLSVESFSATGYYQLSLIEETLKKSMLGEVSEGSKLNLERALTLNTPLDGHFVQGHADTTGRIMAIENEQGSWRITLNVPAKYASWTIPQGSIALNGISLTIADKFYTDTDNKTLSLGVCIIPHTYENTNVSNWCVGDLVNIEFDMLGKYVRSLVV